ncbi:MAG: cation acetate symporter [SAR324 cluster bacterium]|nr:cation acetate symporter [SAR324 cluster bacterium]
MSILTWTYIIVGITFAIYIGIAIATRVSDTKSFYVAGGDIPPLLNGMATGADWMSAASFISMAGLVSFMGYTGAIYLLGWTGGYVLLAILLAPYLRKFGQFTVPDFVGTRYYSDTARMVAAVCAIFVSFTYVAGQMRGVGIVFSRFLNVDIVTGVLIGMVIVLTYATLGGMKGITYTQAAQYVILIFAYLIPAIAISNITTGNPIPQMGFGGTLANGETLLGTLDMISKDLGFPEYTAAFVTGKKTMIDVFAITLALMVGTAGLPHVIIRFYTVPSVAGARWSAVWALLFIGILYTTAPAVASFARYNMINSLNGKSIEQLKSDASAAGMDQHWFFSWKETGLIQWKDLNGDGKIQYRAGHAKVLEHPSNVAHGNPEKGIIVTKNELIVDRDIMVLANPEIAQLPNWVIALVAAGGLAAALSTAAGLLLVISSSISHDFYTKLINPDASEAKKLMIARFTVAVAVCVAGYFGINPPGFVAQVVAFAFGLAASSFFPVIVMGIFSTKTTKEAAITGMILGMGFTILYILQTKFFGFGWYFFGISPEGIGSVGMCINFASCIIISKFTPEPPQEVQEMVLSIRYPRGAGEASAAH